MAAILWDFDGTLIDVNTLYNEAIDAFCAFMVVLGLSDYAAARSLREERQFALLPSLGFARELVPTAMVRTYHGLCAQRGVTPDPSLAATCQAIGYSIFGRVATPVAGAVEAVGALQDAGYRQHVYTMGDYAVQEMRLRQAGWWGAVAMDAMIIVPHKTSEQLMEILDEYDLDARTTVVVGDSMRSDIVPARACGCHAILVAPVSAASWGYDAHPTTSDGVLHAQTLYEVPALVEAVLRQVAA